jgi:hypothetical protein
MQEGSKVRFERNLPERLGISLFITEINIADCRLSGPPLSNLLHEAESAIYLRTLALPNNGLKASDISRVSGFALRTPTLTFLDLSRNRLFMNACKHLSYLIANTSSLLALVLNETVSNHSPMLQLARAVGCNSSLIYLQWLNCCCIRNEYDCAGIVAALEGNTTIIQLHADFGWVQVGEDFGNPLPHPLPNFTTRHYTKYTTEFALTVGSDSCASITYWMLSRNRRLAQERRAECKRSLTLLLGMQKFHRPDGAAGLLGIVPRDVLRYGLAPVIWATRLRVEWKMGNE